MTRGQVTRRAAVAVGAMGAVVAATAMAQTSQEQGKSMTYPVSFPSGSAKLHKADYETIRAVASKMKSDPALVATILGKADAVGSHEFNEHLSWRRAAAVFEVLIFTHKVPEDRVEMRWTGKRMPSFPGEEGKPDLLNRVVEIILH